MCVCVCVCVCACVCALCCVRGCIYTYIVCHQVEYVCVCVCVCVCVHAYIYIHESATAVPKFSVFTVDGEATRMHPSFGLPRNSTASTVITCPSVCCRYARKSLTYSMPGGPHIQYALPRRETRRRIDNLRETNILSKTWTKYIFMSKFSCQSMATPRIGDIEVYK